jgi:hypothetical protein
MRPSFADSSPVQAVFLLARSDAQHYHQVMTIEQLRTMHQAQPFRPFDIHLADGRTLHITHPEIMAIIPPGRTIFVAHSDGKFEIVDLLLAISLKSQNGSTRRGRHRS